MESLLQVIGRLGWITALVAVAPVLVKLILQAVKDIKEIYILIRWTSRASKTLQIEIKGQHGRVRALALRKGERLGEESIREFLRVAQEASDGKTQNSSPS